MKHCLKIIFALCLVSPLNAVAEPMACPSADKVIAGGLAAVESNGLLSWIGVQKSNYDTDTKWGLMLFGFKAQSPEEAMSIALEHMAALYYIGDEWQGPLHWCGYQSSKDEKVRAYVVNQELPKPPLGVLPHLFNK